MDIMPQTTIKTKSHKNGNGKRANPRRHFSNGVYLAALRAFTAAQLYRKGEFKTLAQAARACGSNTVYVWAAAILLEHGDRDRINEVLFGHCSLLRMAESVEPLTKLVSAYQKASPANLAEFRTIVGVPDLDTPAGRTAAARKLGNPEVIWTDMIVPLTAAAE